jgi:hypothetical protein
MAKGKKKVKRAKRAKGSKSGVILSDAQALKQFRSFGKK